MTPKRKPLEGVGLFAPAAPKEPEPRTDAIPQKRPDRIGKRAQLFQLSEAAKKQFAILAIEQDTTQQALLVEAVNDLFRRYNKQPIA